MVRNAQCSKTNSGATLWNRGNLG